MSITYEERYTHPTTADIYGRLDVSHCAFCWTMSMGLGRSWEQRPNSVDGRQQLDVIGRHILNTYTRDEETT